MCEKTLAAFDAFLAEIRARRAPGFWRPLPPTVYEAFVAVRGRAPVDFDEVGACPECVEAVHALVARRVLELSGGA